MIIVLQFAKKESLERLLKRSVDSQSSSGIIMIPSKTLSLRDDFLVHHEVKLIKDILDPVAIKKFVVLGTIVSIRNDYEWTYKGCNVCRFGVREISSSTDDNNDTNSEQNKIYECKSDECKTQSTTFTPRYKIPTVVRDEDASTVLTIVDRLAETMLKMTCKELVAKTIVNGFDVKKHTADLHVLKNKHAAFKVSIGGYNLRTKSN